MRETMYVDVKEVMRTLGVSRGKRLLYLDSASGEQRFQWGYSKVQSGSS